MKVTIVGGAGGVGASTAFNLALMRGAHEVAIVDSRPEMVTSHVMDFEQTLELSPGSRLRAGEMSDLRDCDVAVLLSSSPLVAGMPRIEYLAKNAVVADAFADALDSGWGGAVIVVTNPVDPLVTRLQQRTGLDRRRILGYTLNDSLRLRTGLAKALGVPPGSVEAWVIGEHGDLSVPLYDRVRVNGVPVVLTANQVAVAEEYRRSWYPRHVALDSGRSSTWTSGLGVARMIAALGGDGELWPVSIVLDGEYGIDGVAVTVPATIGRGGARGIHEWELSADELAALHASAEFVRAAAAGI
ncbi:MAG: malate dehydrogenase [Actinomycetota bacterium]|nr:malate dehydrogenase [Actinomycetota bacterium]